MARKPASRPTPIRVRRMRRSDWEHIKDLFGPKGAFGGCWCMWMRVPRGGKEWAAATGRSNRTRFRKRVQAGEVHAVMAFSGKKAVGWCTYGPRDSFPRFQSMPSLRRKTKPNTWSVVCFYIRPGWRGKEVGSRLLEAATEHALRLGASEVEGFPLALKSGKTPNAFAWTGLPSMFKRLGYRKLRRAAGARAIYVKQSP